MFSKKCHFLAFVFAVSVIGFSVNAQAEILFSDNFNSAGTPADPDYALNGNLGGRQGGTLVSAQGPISWARGVTAPVDKVQVNDSTQSGTDMMVLGTNINNHNNSALIQYNFNDQKIVDAGGFTVRFDLDPLATGLASTLKYYGAGVMIGALDGTESNLDGTYTFLGRGDPQVDLAVQFTDGPYTNGSGAKIVSYQHGSAIGVSGAADWVTFDPNPPADFEKMYTFELRVEFAPGGSLGGKLAKAEMWWGLQGTPSESLVQADINGNDDGFSYSWNWDADANNYIGFFGYNREYYSLVDNVSVTIPGEVPEPSTLGLLAAGLIGLLAYAWKKRK